MKYNLALFLFVIPAMVLFYSCKDNPVVTSLQSDSELKSKIIGKWSNGFITIQYDANGNFQDDINLGDSINNNKTESMKGTYIIQDGILSYNLSKWEIVDTSVHPGSSSSSIPDYKLQIEGNQLYFYPLDILTRTSGTGDEIWGEWSTTEWTINYYPCQSNPALFGKLENIYKFNKDSMTVMHATRFLDHPADSLFFMTEKLEYNPPYLNWGYNYHKTIEFHNGHMYLFEKLNETPAPLLKIK